MLLDKCLPAWMTGVLDAAGHDAVHVARIGLRGASDEEVLSKAAADGRVVLSADTDFGELLNAGRRAGPSVVRLRGRIGPRHRVELLLATLETYEAELMRGAIVVVGPSGRVRVRPLRSTERRATQRGSVTWVRKWRVAVGR